MNNKVSNDIVNNKVITYISFAKRSGSLFVGFDATKASVNFQKAKLVLLLDDISDGTQDAIVKVCRAKNVKYIRLPLKSTELIHILYKKSVLMSLSNQNLSSAILKLYQCK